MKTIVFTFGKFNPPTKGHQKIFDKMKEIAEEEDCKYRIFVSPKKEKKGMTHRHRTLILRRMGLTYTYEQNDIRTPFETLEKLEKQGYTDIIMVVGDDRAEEFETRIRPYIGTLYNFNSFEIVKVERNDGISSTKVREYITENKWQKYTESMSDNLPHNKKERLFRDFRKMHGLSMVR